MNAFRRGALTYGGRRQLRYDRGMNAPPRAWKLFDEHPPVLTYTYSFGQGLANALALGANALTDPSLAGVEAGNLHGLLAGKCLRWICKLQSGIANYFVTNFSDQEAGIGVGQLSRLLLGTERGGQIGRHISGGVVWGKAVIKCFCANFS